MCVWILFVVPDLVHARARRLHTAAADRFPRRWKPHARTQASSCADCVSHSAFGGSPPQRPLTELELLVVARTRSLRQGGIVPNPRDGGNTGPRETPTHPAGPGQEPQAGRGIQLLLFAFTAGPADTYQGHLKEWQHLKPANRKRHFQSNQMSFSHPLTGWNIFFGTIFPHQHIYVVLSHVTWDSEQQQQDCIDLCCIGVQKEV